MYKDRVKSISSLTQMKRILEEFSAFIDIVKVKNLMNPGDTLQIEHVLITCIESRIKYKYECIDPATRNRGHDAEILRHIFHHKSLREFDKLYRLLLKQYQDIKIAKAILKRRQSNQRQIEDERRRKEDELRVKEDEERQREDDIRDIEDERRKRDDERRRIEHVTNMRMEVELRILDEDQRRRQEDARRRQEDARRRQEDARRYKENEIRRREDKERREEDDLAETIDQMLLDNVQLDTESPGEPMQVQTVRKLKSDRREKH